MNDDPSLNVTNEQLLGEILSELADHVARGESLDLTPYERKYPELADQLRQLAPTVEAMADLELQRSEVADRSKTQLTNGGANSAQPKPLGDFRIIRELGRGGMGVVYEAEQISLGRSVALKVLPYAAVMDQKAITRFKNEARAAATLDYPNIVPVHAVGNERGIYYYAMSLIDGMTMAEVIGELRQRVVDNCDRLSIDDVLSQAQTSNSLIPDPDATRNENEVDTTSTMDDVQAAVSTRHSQFSAAHYRHVARLALQAAEALDHAHQHGIVHRDIKPGNLMIDSTSKLWVTDFGLARIESDPGVTMTGDLVGTLRYMAPEQALAKRVTVDHRADIYALGATLYELLTLRPVFDHTDRLELIRAIAEQDPIAPRKLNPRIPREMETIVLKCLSREPRHRYASAHDLADDLCRFCDNKPVAASRPSWNQRVAKWCQRHTSLVAGSACILATVLIAVAIVSTLQRRAADAKLSLQQSVAEELAEAARLRSLMVRDPLKGKEYRVSIRGHVQRALALIETGQADEASINRVRHLATEIETEQRDERLLESLTQAYLNQRDRFSPGDVSSNIACISMIRDALLDYGVNLEATSTEAADQIQTFSAVPKESIITALMVWQRALQLPGRPRSDVTGDGSARASMEVSVRAEWVQNVLRLIDSDHWRQRYRQANESSLNSETRNLFESLAHDPAYEVQPPQVMLQYSEALLSHELHGSARAALRIAQRLHPNDAIINARLAQSLSSTDPKRPGEAAAYWRAAIALRPGNSLLHHELAAALESSGDDMAAESELRHAIEIDPRDPLTLCSLARLLRKVGREDEASEQWAKAIRLVPEQARWHYEYADLLEEQRKTREALARYEQAIRLDPNFAPALARLACILTTSQDPQIRDVDRAIGLSRRADSLSNENSIVAIATGLIRFEQRRWPEVVNALKPVVDDETLPTSLRLRGQLALVRALLELQNFEDANRWYKKAESWAHDHPFDDKQLGRFFHDVSSHERIARTMDVLLPRSNPKESISDLQSPFDGQSLTYIRSAILGEDGQLRFPPAPEPGDPYRSSGAAWLAEKRFISGGFSTTFEFRRGAANPERPTGGFAFAIQNDSPDFVGKGGQSMGYGQLRSSLVVEFDFIRNDVEHDPPSAHVSIHTRGRLANSPDETYSIGIAETKNLDDGSLHAAKIVYSSHTLKVFIDDFEKPLLAVPVDLADKLSLREGQAWLGFTAATQHFVQSHDVLGWRLHTPPPPPSIAWVEDVSQIESDAPAATLRFSVVRDGDVSKPATVLWKTVDQSATASSGDYELTAGKVVFAAGQSVATVEVDQLGDDEGESHESFGLHLTDATNVTITDGVGRGTILNDDLKITVKDAVANPWDDSYQFAEDLVPPDQDPSIGPSSIVIGNDGNDDGVGEIYVIHNGKVLRYDGRTGQFLGTFVETVIGEQTRLGALRFGPDGNGDSIADLYVAFTWRHEVRRYDGTTGAYIDDFVPSRAGGLTYPRGMTFGPDGNLYVSSADNGDSAQTPDEVLVYEGTTGDFIKVLIENGNGGLDDPNGIVFVPNGDMFVAMPRSRVINRYNARTSELVSTITLSDASGIQPPKDFGYHRGSLVVLADSGKDIGHIKVFDPESGELLANTPDAKLQMPLSLAVHSDGTLIVASGGRGSISRYAPASFACFPVTLDQPTGEPVTIEYETSDGSAKVGVDYVATNGTITFAPGQTRRTIQVETMRGTTSDDNEFTLRIFRPSKDAVIQGDTAIGKIRRRNESPTHGLQ